MMKKILKNRFIDPHYNAVAMGLINGICIYAMDLFKVCIVAVFYASVHAKFEHPSLSLSSAMESRMTPLVPSRVPASDPVGSTGQDKVGAAASSEGLQAFPVLQGATHNTYQPLAWQALIELRDAVGRYGLGSAEDWLRGDGGFGFTGPPQVHWTAVLTKDHPETLCTMSMVGATPSEIHLPGLLDTGADVSILSLAAWPLQWPLTLAKTSIARLGGTKQCYMSQNSVAITNPEGQTAIIWPHVTEIPQNLWGRDVLAAWGV
ncbi:hypothetical protein DUI87_22331 [Hirundo rustica rustica]|uniref:Peptidase A2 domain-containing protein n=1 Tax=Hirundo rustica rustica TaxID=333673 RepID=A0A3M0K1R2_HIRRU|nr:hypothetical protein DUI87_22331 [Hirundo rustica rustica]